jgi:hypothetical protein
VRECVCVCVFIFCLYLEAHVRVNGQPLPVMYRQPGSAMGKAGRDPPVTIPLGVTAVEGTNRLSVQCQDQRAFSVLLRLVRRRTLDEVKGLVPAPATFPTARAFLERSLGGGGGGSGGGDDSDDDLIVQDNAVLSLRCPVSGLVCATPARTRGCRGLAVFDLNTYLELNAKVRKWTCPHCGVSGRPQDIVIDGFLTRVLGVLRAREKARGGVDTTDVSRVEVEPSGRWRPCPEEGERSKSGGGAAWIPPEAMNGVVLGIGGSVLHVPPELIEAGEGGASGSGGGGSGSGGGGGAAVKQEVNLDDDGDETDEEEELRRAIAEASEGRQQSGGRAAPVDDDVICISDSDDNEDGAEGVPETPASPASLPPRSAHPAPVATTNLNHQPHAGGSGPGPGATPTTRPSGLNLADAPMGRVVPHNQNQNVVNAQQQRAAAAAAVAAASSSAALAAMAAAASAAVASYQATMDSQRLNSAEVYAAASAAYYEQRESAGGVSSSAGVGGTGGGGEGSQTQAQTPTQASPGGQHPEALLAAQRAMETTTRLLQHNLPQHHHAAAAASVTAAAASGAVSGAGAARVSTEVARSVPSPGAIASGEARPTPKLLIRFRRPSEPSRADQSGSGGGGGGGEGGGAAQRPQPGQGHAREQGDAASATAAAAAAAASSVNPFLADLVAGGGATVNPFLADRVAGGGGGSGAGGSGAGGSGAGGSGAGAGGSAPAAAPRVPDHLDTLIDEWFDSSTEREMVASGVGSQIGRMALTLAEAGGQATGGGGEPDEEVVVLSDSP